MEDVEEEEPVFDIDNDSLKDPLSVVDYVADIYDHYKKTEASHPYWKEEKIGILLFLCPIIDNELVIFCLIPRGLVVYHQTTWLISRKSTRKCEQSWSTGLSRQETFLPSLNYVLQITVSFTANL